MSELVTCTPLHRTSPCRRGDHGGLGQEGAPPLGLFPRLGMEGRNPVPSYGGPAGGVRSGTSMRRESPSPGGSRATDLALSPPGTCGGRHDTTTTMCGWRLRGTASFDWSSGRWPGGLERTPGVWQGSQGIEQSLCHCTPWPGRAVHLSRSPTPHIHFHHLGLLALGTA